MSDQQNVSAQRLRLFFALWPDSPVRAELDAAAEKLHTLRGGRRTRADTIHLTLVFIGEIASERLGDVLAAAEGLAVPKFDLLFDHADCWRHNRVAHLGVSRTPPALSELVRQLEARLDAAAIPFDRRPYVPHITLLRKADCSAEKTNPALAPIRWLARDLVLVNSSLRSGEALYKQLGRWPLL
ncbi:MAG: RNA 2',3'-cyclic phosphodiesterase [Pseudomonadota bacterium]|nr:RNA 2',3'-cyclic phosphodiesterase [Pseudomonadota bacterium]MDP1903733.1 RNA 2',3'-cyclic phosphodiesterase [Pseudomonadota bacterium]MDP2351705.1 RNA 2',3'-cyclic phosphodiesterase [Pseudomonadota bacterium]